MYKDLLYFITKDIKDLYFSMALNDNDNEKKKNKLKELISIERDIYDNLSFEEAKSLLDQFIKDNNNDSDEFCRVWYRLNSLLDDKYFYESLNDEENLNKKLEDLKKLFITKEDIKNIMTCKKYIIRDIRLLCLYNLKLMEEQGFIINDYCIGTDYLNAFRKTQICLYAFFYPDFEKEFIDNDFKLINYNLIGKLSYQLLNIPFVFYEIAKEEAIYDMLEIISSDIDSLKNFSMKEFQNPILLLNLVALINSVAIIDDNLLVKLENNLIINNDFLKSVILDNINNIKKEKKNIKYLSLRKNDKCY